MSDRRNHTVMNGVPMVCYGLHERHEGCEWEPLEPEGLSREQIQQGWRDYDAATASDAEPLPAPKRDIIREVVECLRDHGDYFGVKLIESGFIGEDAHAEEDAEDSERARQA